MALHSAPCGPSWSAAEADNDSDDPSSTSRSDHRRVIDVSHGVAAACSDGVVRRRSAGRRRTRRWRAGGATRSDSVRAGLAAVPADAEVICVHDAARPLATADLYRRVIDAVLDGADAAIPGDRGDRHDQGARPTRRRHRRRLGIGRRHPGPGAPRRGPDARRRSAPTGCELRTRSGSDATDDAALVEAAGGTVVVVRGDPINRKITEPDDLDWARRQFAAEVRPMRARRPARRPGIRHPPIHRRPRPGARARRVPVRRRTGSRGPQRRRRARARLQRCAARRRRARRHRHALPRHRSGVGGRRLDDAAAARGRVGRRRRVGRREHRLCSRVRATEARAVAATRCSRI